MSYSVLFLWQYILATRVLPLYVLTEIMARMFGKRSDSVLSFGTPVERIEAEVGMRKSTLQSSDSSQYSAASKKKKRPRRRVGGICIFMIVITTLHILAIGMFLLAELLSRPGYDKKTQDTVSNATRQRIQETRKAMVSMAPRISTGRAIVSKQELVNYIQLASAYSAAAYTAAVTPQNCNNPVWSTLVRPVTSSLARAYIARDDVANLLVVAFKGMTGPRDFATGLDNKLVPFHLANVTDATVQRGILDAYQSIEIELITAVTAQSAQLSNYTILVTGHNIGGSMAVLASLAIKQLLPSQAVLVVTQGQSKTFNQAAVDYIDRVFPADGHSLIRAVHTEDGIPVAGAPFVNANARHHSGEVWQFKDPAVPENVVICRSQNDLQCSKSNTAAAVQVLPPALPWSAESMHYFDIEMGSTKSVQCGGPGGQAQYAMLTSRRLFRGTPQNQSNSSSIEGIVS